MADVEAVAEVGAALSPDSLTALTETIAKALEKGFAKFGDKLRQAMRVDLGKIQRDVAAGAKKIADQYDLAAKSAGKLRTGLRGADTETLKLVQAMTELAQSQKVIQSAIVKSGIVTRQQMIAQRIESDRTQQKVIEDARNSAKVIATQAQVAGQQQIVATRYAGQQRVQITRAVIENIARLERGLAATIAGIARTAVGATGKVFGSLTSMFSRGGSSALNTSSFTSSIRRMNTELNRDVSTSLSRRESTMRSSFMRQERMLVESATRQAKTLEVMRRQTSTGVLGAATGRGVGPGLVGGLAAGAGVGALLTSGFTRFSDIERLTKQFTALTGSAEQAAMMLAQVKEFAKLTPFDLVGVADLAKGMLAIGTAAEDVMPRVKVLSDAVAFTGGTIDSMDRIRRAIGQVVSIGRLQGDELNQLAENLPGLNIVKLLANQITGGDTRKLMEMKEAGDISAEMFVDALIAGLGSDPRLVGAAEDLAETLSGRVANLKESFADFGASLIGLVAGPLRSAVLGTQTVLQGLADFVKGEGLSAAFETLRTAIGGVAIGLGSIVAAKGAVEVFGLLARSAGLLLTPFGMLLTAAGLIGGAIAVMIRHNDRFRAALEAVGDRIGEVVGKIREMLQPALDWLGAFVEDTIIPGLTRFAEFLANNLVGAFDRAATFITGTAIPAVGDFIAMVGRGLVTAFREASAFITDTVIPALNDFVRFIRAEVFPIAERVGTWVAARFMTALRAVQDFGRRIRPYVQPAIDGFKALGRGIAEVFGGDWAALGRGALGALGGLGRTIANLFGLALEALKPLGRRIMDWLGELFTLANLQKAFGKVLDAVYWLGDQIGSIISSPQFIAALAGIALAAAQVGIHFIQGVLVGIRDNLPALADALGAILKELFTLAFDPTVIGLVLGGALLLKGLKPLIAQFRSAGAEAGTAFSGGLGSRLGAQGAGGFARGLFGGADAVQLAATKRFWKTQSAEVQGLQNQIRVLGGTMEVAMSPKSIAAAKREIDNLSRGLTNAEIRGLQLRDRMTSVFASIGGAIKGAFGMLKGLGQVGGTALGAPLKAIGLGMKAALMPANEFARTGVTWGTSLSQGFARGFSTIKTSWTQMMATMREQAASQNTSLGKAMMASGATAAHSFAAGFGAFLTGKFMGQAGMGAGTATLSGAIAGAMMMPATPVIGAVVGGGAGFIGSLLGADQAAAQRAKERVKEYATAIKTDLVATVKGAMPTMATWADILAGEDTRETDVFRLTQERLLDVLPTMHKFGITTQDVIDALAQGPEAMEALLDKFGDTDFGSNANDAIIMISLAWEEARAALDDYNVVLNDSKTAMQRIRDLFPSFFGINPFPSRAPEISPEDTAFARSRMQGPNATTPTTRATPNVVVQKMKEVQEASREAWQRLRGVNAAWDDLAAAPNPAGPKQLEQDMIDLQAAADDAAESITRALTPPDVSTLTAAISEAILTLRGGGKIGTADEKGIIDFDPSSIFDAAELVRLKQTISTQVAPVISAGLAEGIDPVAAFDLARPAITQSLLDGVTDPEIKAAIEASLENIRVGLVVEMSDKTPLIEQADVDFARGRMRGPAAVKVPVEVEKVDVAKVSAEQRGFFDLIGAAMGGGMTAGIRRMIGSVRNAATEMAKVAQVAVTSTLRISSPSKVMISLGEQIGAGLAEGIRNSESGVLDSVDSIVSEIIGKFHNADLGSNLASQMFSQLSGSKAPLGPGGQSQLGFTTQVGQFTAGFNGLLSTFASNVTRVFDIAAKKAEERTPADLDVMGESPFSLSVFDVLGAANVEAFVGLFDQIHEMGTTLFAEGKSVTEVFSMIQGFRDQVLSWAQGVGFSAEQLSSLVDAIGLSDSALVSFAAGLANATGGLGAGLSASGPGGTTPGGMTAERAKEIQRLEIEALTLSPEDLEVFRREHDLGWDFIQKLRTTQADVSDNSDDENRALGRALGLWGDALEAFVERLDEWAQEQGTRPNDDGPPQVVELPRPIQVDIHPPYGDPVAIGIGAANAVARRASFG